MAHPGCHLARLPRLSKLSQRALSIAVALSAIAPAVAFADKLEEVEVVARRLSLLGEAQSAAQGVITQQEIEIRPLLRTGDVLELVPGMVATQHSGSGKANQYFLRGFNLDHGTDFATYVDDMPVNMPTHGHGQGYTDLNFVIPETIDRVAYKKGPYYAEVNDFSSAGSAAFSTANGFGPGLVEVGAGEDAFYRGLAMGSLDTGAGTVSGALEWQAYDGPWSDIEEDVDKLNGLFKYHWPVADGEAYVQAMGYHNEWNSADQIPERAVKEKLIDELGSIDDSLGGESSRYSLSGGWRDAAWNVSAYAIRYDMKLWSNFTYFLDDPVDGDQFQQKDDRWIYGGVAEHTHSGELFGLPATHRFGTRLRYDDIDAGLYRSERRERLGAVRSDDVGEFASGLFYENTLALTDRLRSTVGVRYDYFDFDVDSAIGENINGVDLSENSGSDSADKVSLKGNLVYAISSEWETYVSAGQGLHSNDARGTTTEVDPSDGSAVQPVDPLVESLGYEVGVRGVVAERLNLSASLWQLELDSELLFVGDAGTTEASRQSERKGLEVTAYYQLTDIWTADVEYANSDARFTDAAPEGDHIPGAIEQVVQAGISAQFAQGWFGALRLRYFDGRPLVEDDSVRSDDSTVLNLRVGYQQPRWSVKLDVLNLLDSDDHDIDYFYASRLPGEPDEGVEDIHYHVLEPRTARLYLRYQL